MDVDDNAQSVPELVRLVHLQAASLAAQAARLEEQSARLTEQCIRLLRLENRAGQPDGPVDATPCPVRDRVSKGPHAALLPEPPERLDRRGLMTRAGKVALGAGAATVVGALAARPAAASIGVVQYGTFNDAGADTTTLSANTGEFTVSFDNFGAGGNALRARTFSTNAGAAIESISLSAAPAVYGRSLSGSGVGVVGKAASTAAGVQGVMSGSGSAVHGKNESASGTAGVLGEAIGTTKGLWGRHTGTDARGIGVYGDSTAGRGASLGGKLAQLRLRPSAAAVPPATGEAGDLFVDRASRLWFCKGSSLWTQLA